MLPPDPIRPAFRSRRAAAIYCACLTAFLAAPLLLHAFGLPRPRQAYREMPAQGGDFAFVEQQIFDVTDDLDVVFLGSSHLRCGIDVPYLRQQLSERLGRGARVATLGFNWGGEDMVYALLRELLRKRKVGTVVLYVDYAPWMVQDEPHPLAFHLLDPVGEPSILNGLGLRQMLRLYAGAVLGSPRHVLGLLRPDPIGESVTEAALGFTPIPGDAKIPRRLPPDPASLVYGPSTRASFVFAGVPMAPYHLHFLLLEAALLREHGVRTILLAMPHRGLARDGRVSEAADWPSVMQLDDARMIGVAPSVLFEGMTDADVDAVFHDDHLTARGARYFTRFLTPALLENIRPAW
jgi:hypothetical protein